MASSTQDEEPELDQNKEAKTDDEAKHEEPELHLNIEAKTDDEKIVASESETREAKRQKVEQEAKDTNQEDDAKKILASETSATSEQEVKDANQEEESRRGTRRKTRRSLAQEKAKAKEDDYDEDDSAQTLTFLTRWKAPETPPERIIYPILVEQCSKTIQKQLTTSDMKQSRLSLSYSQVGKKFQQLLGDESGRKESGFTVYGPDGKVHEIWLRKKKKAFDLTIGWWTFVEEYGLKECCDFVTVWMFRHRVTQRICLAIDATRFSISKQVSKRIYLAAFGDSD